MNLLVVSSWLPHPPDNGSRIRAFNLLRQLSRRHEITLLTFGEAADAEGLAALRDLCQRVALARPVHRRSAVSAIGGLVSATPRHLVQKDNTEMRALVAESAGRHAAAIGLEVEGARYLDGYSAIPRVFDGVEVTVYRDRAVAGPHPLRRWRHRLTWWKFGRYIRRLVTEFSRATVVSAIERQRLQEVGCDVGRVSIVPNGMEAGETAPNPPRAERLVYPGAVTYEANLDAVRFFVEAVWPIVRQRRPAMEFWVTGETGAVDLERLRAPGVVFTGRVPDIERVVAESAACVVPLRIGGGTRVKVLQAMAVGAPVVSTPKGVEGLDVEPGRHVLVAETPERFAEQVLRIVEQPEAVRRLTTDAWRFVRERHGWREVGDALDRTIADAIAEHRGRRAGGARRP